MAPRRRCTICGSKQWHKEPSSGLVVCSEGHVLLNYRNETQDDVQFGAHAVRKRALKSQRKRKGRPSKADPKFYHGARARYLYFQCLQLLLRKQVAALIHLWELPPEFGIICRDIWTLHLNLLPSPPPAEPYYHARESYQSEDSDKPLKNEEGPENDLLPDSDVEDLSDSGSHSHASSASSVSGSEDDDLSDDPEMAALLRENSESGSSGSEGENVPPAPTERGGKKRAVGTYETPMSNIAVLALTCWTMRVPIVYMDFVRAIERYDLPYLDLLRLLPAQMTMHLSKYTKKSLSPRHAPATLAIHALASQLARKLQSQYGITTPATNAAPVMWRGVRALGGTPVLYAMTKTLARTLSLPLTLHHTLAPGLAKIRKQDPTVHKYDSVPPEVAFVATSVVVLKMVYGLDGKPRSPENEDDVACALPSVESYLATLSRVTEETDSAMANILGTKAQISVGDLAGEQLDAYLDLCQSALLTPGGGEEENDVLAQYFPLQQVNVSSPPDAPSSPRNAPSAERLTTSRSVPNVLVPNTLGPGQSYAMYRACDVSGTLPATYERVLTRGARWLGVGTDDLGAAVERYEGRLLRWWTNVRRRQREEELADEERQREERAGSSAEPY